MNGYDILAPVYQILTKLFMFGYHKKSQHIFLNRIPKGQKILILGGGDGQILPELLSKKPMSIDYVETSTKMIRLAKKNVPKKFGNDCINWINESDFLKKQNSNDSYDFIIAFYFLDLFPVDILRHVLLNIRHIMNKKSTLLVADFQCPDQIGWLKKTYLKCVLLFFKITTNHPNKQITAIRHLLVEAGFHTYQEAIFFGGLIFSLAARLKTIDN